MAPADFLTLSCRACGAPVPEDRFDEGRGIARCGFCGALTPLPRRPASRQAALAVSVEARRNVTVEETAFGARIVRRWRSPAGFLLVGMGIVWCAMLAGFYGMMSKSGAPWFFRLFPLVHAAVGFGILYSGLVCLVNRTVIEIARGDVLTVRHGPLPWPGRPVTLETADIQQLFVVDKRYARQNGESSSLYILCAATKDGRRVKLAAGMIKDIEQAIYLEQVIEKRLGIANRPVVGEVRPDGSHFYGDRDDDPEAAERST